MTVQQFKPAPDVRSLSGPWNRACLPVEQVKALREWTSDSLCAIGDTLERDNRTIDDDCAVQKQLRALQAAWNAVSPTLLGNETQMRQMLANSIGEVRNNVDGLDSFANKVIHQGKALKDATEPDTKYELCPTGRSIVTSAASGFLGLWRTPVTAPEMENRVVPNGERALAPLVARYLSNVTKYTSQFYTIVQNGSV